MRRFRTYPQIGGAKALPYDAEVDYIELTGTQYAVLPFEVPNKRYEIDVEMTNTTSEQCLIGCRSGSSNRIYPLHVVNGVWNLIHAYASINSSAVTTSKVHVSAYCAKGKQMLSVDGEDLVESSDPNNVNSNFAFLGACNVSGSRQLFAKAKISRLVVYDANGELVFDAISVRFTNELGVSEGAMYDRVSGQLFRNKGTGAFVIGPDKVAWVNPYKTVDGMTFMFDAIWNRGGDLPHDNQAESWADCCGFLPDIPITNTGSFVEGGLLLSGTKGDFVNMSSGQMKADYGDALLASYEHGYSIELLLSLSDSRSVGGTWVTWDGTSVVNVFRIGDLPYCVSTADLNFGGYGSARANLSNQGFKATATVSYPLELWTVVVDIDNNETRKYRNGVLVYTTSGASCAGYSFSRFGVGFCRVGYSSSANLPVGNTIHAYRCHTGLIDDVVKLNYDVDMGRYGGVV